MNLSEEARAVLEGAGYSTAFGPASSSTVYFEDDILIGAVFVHDTVGELLSGWEECQDRFLGRNSRAIRSDPIKAWNIYTVHLTSGRGNASQLSDAFSVEQDFRGTRKIVRLGIVKRSDVREAFLPLLPLQTRTILSSGDITGRLTERLALSSKTLAKLVEQPKLPSVEEELLEEP